jgi:uncharacterized protein
VKLSRDNLPARLITGFDGKRIFIDGTAYSTPVIVVPDHDPAPWTVSDPARIEYTDLQPALDRRPELIILGTGACQVFPDPRITAAIMREGIGFESMRTDAACRTFNLLAGEGRLVAAALFV